MKVRFDVNDAEARDELIGVGLGDAFQSLVPQAVPSWGGFSAAQMVEHLLWGFEVSTGRQAAAAATPEEWQRKARAFLHDHRPMPRGFENPLLKNGLPPLRFRSLLEATVAATREARRFLDLSSADPWSRHIHPVFGDCSMEEWSRIHFKHCVHHLLQFNLIEVEEVARPGP